MTADAIRIAEDLLTEESALLDAERWEDWLALLTDDVVYWVPLEPTATSPADAPSLFHEDRALLDMRCRRFRHERAFGREGGFTTLHQVTAIRATRDGDAVEAESHLVVHEFRDDRLTLYPGRQRHRLHVVGGRWRIARKEVRLISMTGVFDPIEIIL